MSQSVGKTNITLVVNRILLTSSCNEKLGLLNGKMGEILFFLYFYKYSNDEFYKESSEMLISELVEEIHQYLTYDFEEGYTGIGWAFELIIQEGFISGYVNNVLSDFDKIIFDKILISFKSPNQKSPDFLDMLFYVYLRFKVNPILKIEYAGLFDLITPYFNYFDKSRLNHANNMDILKDVLVKFVSNRFNSNEKIVNNDLDFDEILTEILYCKSNGDCLIGNTHSDVKKNIIVIYENDISSEYGIGTYLNEFVKCIKGEKFNIIIVCLNANCSEIKHIYDNGILSIRIPYINVRNRIKYIRNVSKIINGSVPELKSYFFINNDAILDIVEPINQIWSEVVIFYILHNIEYSAFIHKNSSFINNLSNIDYIICLSNYTKKYLVRILNVNAEKILVIHNGAEDLYPIFNSCNSQIIRSEFNIHTNDKIVLYVGRVDLLKGILNLILAFNHLIKLRPECRLIIVGDGLLSEYIPLCYNFFSRVSFTGKVSREDLIKFYRIADLVVLPSWGEQCSYVGIEVLMLGIPSIISDSPGIDEMFDEGVDTIAKIKLSKNNNVPIHETEIFCNTINSALNFTSKDKEKLRINSRRKFLSTYSIHVMKKKYIELLTDN